MANKYKYRCEYCGKNPCTCGAESWERREKKETHQLTDYLYGRSTGRIEQGWAQFTYTSDNGIHMISDSDGIIEIGELEINRNG
jgi:hypothetical protein